MTVPETSGAASPLWGKNIFEETDDLSNIARLTVKPALSVAIPDEVTLTLISPQGAKWDSVSY